MRILITGAGGFVGPYLIEALRKTFGDVPVLATSKDPLAQAVQIEAGPVAIDLVRHVATVRGEPVNLTRSEFQLLRLMVGRPGEVFPRRQIMEELWQTEFDGDERACDVHISNLRQKVERDPQNPELIVTVRGVGYKFSGNAA